jgi:hypothetical protein
MKLFSKIFLRNQWFEEARGDIPYWVISNQLGVHKNTLRNWMEREMTTDKKAKVLNAIAEIKNELAEAQ